MAKGMYLGVSGKAQKVKKAYIGVDGKARKIKKMYIGDANGKARLFWSGRPNATRWLTVYTMGGTSAFYSTNLSSWTEKTSAFVSARGVTFGDGKFYLVGYSQGGQGYALHNIYASTDGVTWTQQLTNMNLGQTKTAGHNGFCYCNGKLFLTIEDGQGNYGSTSFKYSADGGMTWTTVTGQTGEGFPVNVTYGLVKGYSSPKYFVYATKSGGPDNIWVYDENFNYEKTIPMPNDGKYTVYRYSTKASSNSFMGISNGSLKLMLRRHVGNSSEGDYGAYLLAVYKNDTISYKYKKVITSNASQTLLGGFVCTDEITAFFNDYSFVVYDDATDTAKIINSPSGVTTYPKEGYKGCFDGERYIFSCLAETFYTRDKGTTWTKVITSTSYGYGDVQCNTNGGGSINPE